jgi:hypothetical protein
MNQTIAVGLITGKIVNLKEIGRIISRFDFEVLVNFKTVVLVKYAVF